MPSYGEGTPWGAGSGSGGTGGKAGALNLKLLLELGQISRCLAGDENDVFESDASDLGVIEAGFDGDDVTGPEGVVGAPVEAGGFMDFEADAVAGAMEESLHVSVAAARFEAGFPKGFFGREMNLGATNAIAEVVHGGGLGTGHRGVHGSDMFRGPPANDRPCDIPEVAGALGSGKDIDDDRFIGPEFTVSALVGVAALAAAGDDGVGGVAARLEDGGIDDGAESFGGEG